MKRFFADEQRRFLSLRVAWRRQLTPILLGLLSLLYFGLLGSPPPAHAEEPIFIDSGQSLGNLTSTDVATGDLDGDGDLDAFVTNTDYSETGQPNQVWLNNGRAGFVLSQSLGDARSTGVELGDLDGDGDLDAFVANGNPNQFLDKPNQVVGEANRVWLNDGSGHFTDSGQRLGGLVSMAIALGDLDHDGDLDAFVANIHIDPQLAANRIWLNNGDGTFQESDLRLGDSSSAAVALADLNGDGHLDAFVGNSEICSLDYGCFGDPNNKVWLNRGELTFEDSDQTLGDLNSLAVELADLNGDGHLDAFIGNGDIFYLEPSEQPNKVWLNDGTGHFTDSGQRMANLDTFGLTLEDIDGDGDQDAVVANSNDQGLGTANQVWQNDGSGNFDIIQSMSESLSLAVAVGDLNNNGQLDFWVANVGGNEVWLNDSSHFTLGQSLEQIDDTRALAAGDLNGDGHLDLLVGNYDQADQIWINNGGGQFELGPSLGGARTYAVALGDLDGDGDLDILIGNNQRANEVWLKNEDGIFEQVQELENSLSSFAVALGDLDHDGDLDAFVGHGNVNRPQPEQPNKVWFNDGTGHFSEHALVGNADSRAVALGDLDNDNDLDAYIANHGHNEVWLNNGSGEFELRQTTSNAESNTVALGDLDGDGDLDAFVGNNFEPAQVWLNDGSGYFTDSEQTLVSSDSRAVSLGDLDGDGDLDAIVGNVNAQPDKVLLNDGQGNFTTSHHHSFGLSNSKAIALGDFSGDGNLDFVIGIGNETALPNQVYLGNGGALTRAQLSVQKPVPTEDAYFQSSPEILTERRISITYTLFEPQSAPMGQVKAYYSMNGGDNWQVAVPTSDTITTNLATAPYSTTTEVNRHLFVWDTFASGFFGQSDNVVLRFVAHAQPVATGVGGTYQYSNQVPAANLWPIATTTTFPFRVRGMQVQVSDENGPVAGAMVYRLPAGESVGAQALTGSSNQPYRTAQNGYLQGQGQLAIGDQLMAMLPITTTAGYTLYHTSAAPSETGLQMQPVTTPGVQALQLSAAHPLLIFDLDVSLEWDARRDNIFLSQLEYDLKRASEMLYDLTNGQVALGELHVHHAREQWAESDILIYGSNNLRPSAALGGIVENPVSERVKRSDRPISETLTISNSQVISDAYLGGQVRMSAIWNRFGHPGGSVGEDWPRTLAHELGHYLLFIPDNYLGLSAEQRLIKLDCQGSAMTDAYRQDYSEFLTRAGWTGDCERTMAQYTTGRTDWETISTFYQMLNATGGNMGPSHLPLNLTQVSFTEPDRPVNTLRDPFFNITNEDGNPLALSFGDSEGYLFKRQGTSPDVVVSLGSPIADLLRVRGAEPGDRLCLFDYSQKERRIGCIDSITPDSSNLSLYEVPGWEPQIEVNVVTSRTLTITVTQQLEPSEALHVQILPASAHLSATAPLPMTPVAPDTFVQAITLNAPIASGFVRLWLPDAHPPREAINEISLSGDWPGDGGGNAWGPNKRRYNWMAPVRARDGQVTIFDLDHIFGSNPPYALQSLATPPNLPLWLTPVGQAYRFSAAEALTGTLNIMFEYMQREVPGDEEGEERLRIYYLNDGGDGGEGWQRLETELDDHRNLASARIQGEGTYVLISTIEMPPFNAGWNNFGYPVANRRPITSALGPIDGYYDSVYHYDGSLWHLYDPGVTDEQPQLANLVNDLSHLEFGHGYWLHAKEEITLYLGVTNSSQRNAMSAEGGLQLPPATFYGWIAPSDSLTPTVGMAITARIEGNLCGHSTIQEIDGRLAYKVQVMAEHVFGEPNGCGASGKSVTFEVEDIVIGEAQAWDNSQASYHPLPHQTFSSQLVPGWNLLSLPLQPADSAVQQVLTSIAGNYDTVYAYDGCDANDPWKKYTPSAPFFANDLTNIEVGMGLWINMTITDTLELTGSEVTSATMPLCEAWNLVGYPSQQTRSITDALAPIEGHYSIIYGYDAADANDPWKKYEPTAPPFANDLREMRPGQGYWIKANEDVTWEIGE